ncbi:hypothetical protein RUM43_000259 [Polyplax serrata]|uniref:Uncharacterized protein n=1 Tax=Polyplax serrata TaxID=468196 RepID=A0AAN8SD46_POLSC
MCVCRTTLENGCSGYKETEGVKMSRLLVSDIKITPVIISGKCQGVSGTTKKTELCGIRNKQRNLKRKLDAWHIDKLSKKSGKENQTDVKGHVP